MSANDWGPQYPKDDPFKARARLHQSRFRADVLGLDECRDYGNRLSTRDALAGRNLHEWPGVVEAVAVRYGRKDSPVWHDMLRSEHIPFNLFVPLRDLRWARILFGEWLGSPVSAVTQILVEWAPKPRRVYLNDNTSFDTWVECRLEDGRRAGIGVEVKYTEGPYSVTHQRHRDDFRGRGRQARLRRGGHQWQMDGRSRTRRRRGGACSRRSGRA